MLIFHRADKNKSRKITAKSIIKSKIDIKSGDMTFGQRIELGKIFSGGQSEIVKFQKIFECLHGFTPMIKDYPKLMSYFNEIALGVKHWIDVEILMLKYEPTQEEKQAGIKELSTKVGEMGTVKALAKNYSVDPDIILSWRYSKVFGILYTDLEESKFQRRYQNVLSKKK